MIDKRRGAEGQRGRDAEMQRWEERQKREENEAKESVSCSSLALHQWWACKEFCV